MIQVIELIFSGAGVGLLVAMVYQLATIKAAVVGLNERVGLLETWRRSFPFIHVGD